MKLRIFRGYLKATLTFLPVHLCLNRRIEGYSLFRALDILRHARGDEGHAVGLIVGSGGEDQRLATQVFVPAGGDVVLDGLATLWGVDAKGGVLLGGGIEASGGD